MPEPSSPWGRESDTAPRERKMTQGHASSPGPHAEHKTEAPTLSRPEEEADSRRRRKRRGGGSRGKSLGPCPAAHTEADAAGVAQPPLPPRLRQMFIFNPVGSEMLSHSATSYQSQIISITCLLTLPPATQPAACKKGVLQVLPCLLEETIIIIIITLRAEPWSSAGGQEPPNLLPTAQTDGKGSEGTSLCRREDGPPAEGSSAVKQSSRCWECTYSGAGLAALWAETEFPPIPTSEGSGRSPAHLVTPSTFLEQGTKSRPYLDSIFTPSSGWSQNTLA